MPRILLKLLCCSLQPAEFLSDCPEIADRIINLRLYCPKDIKDCPCHLIQLWEVLDLITVLDERADHPAVGHDILAATNENPKLFQRLWRKIWNR